MLSYLKTFATRLLATRNCLLCLQASNTLICYQCNADLASFNLRQCDGNLLNRPDIRNGLARPLFSRLLAFGPYQWPLTSLIKQMKFNQSLTAVRALGELLSIQLAPYYSPACQVIPVPLHPRRLQKRRYNQCYLLAKELSKYSQFEILHTLVARKRETPAQSGMGVAQRRSNLRGAFIIEGRVDFDRVILLDDVITTGSTVNEICRMLLQQNPALRIDVWALCVTLKR